MSEKSVTGPWVVERNDNGDGTFDVSVGVNTAELSGLTVVDHSDDGVPIVGIRGPEDLALIGGVPEGYTLEWYRPNSWPIQTRDPEFGGTAKRAKVVLARQARGTFKAPPGIAVSARQLLDELRQRSPHRRKYKYTPSERSDDKNMLEISIPDLHYGLQVWAPTSGGNATYGMDIAERLFMSAIEELLRLARGRKYEYILFPIGNDYLHVDNLDQATTKGTLQQDAAEWHHMFSRGRNLLITAIDRLKKVAPVKVVSVPGNHDAVSSLHMSMIIEAYYHNDPNVEVDASPQTIKYHEYGKNLIGFEHGKAIQPVRLAAIMAEDQPEAWARTQFREWHLGHQHRKGGAWFQEQSVGIEYIPSLSAINTWHREHAFTWRRAAWAYVWNKERGPLSRLQINIDPNNPEELLGEL